jgi:hypothetical protein
MLPMQSVLLLALLHASSMTASSVRSVITSIRNDEPRLDATSTIMDAHDMSLRLLPDGTYVMHAIEYGLCEAPTDMGCDGTADHCGFRQNHNVTVWTSPDLSSGSWRLHGYAFDLSARPPGLLFRPDAIFNPNTNLWVLFYNDASNGNAYISSVAPTAFGPFTDFQRSNVTDATWSGGDFHLFNDGLQGYIIWTGMSSLPGQDHKIRISKLTSDWRGATADKPFMFDADAPTTTFNEAPSIFERNGVWYALFGHCCCFCMQGSGLFVHTAPHPMGPWTAASANSPYDIACEAPSVAFQGIPTPGQGCLYGGSTDISVTRSQQDFLATVPDGRGGNTYLYFGSRWGQSPDGLKGHEPQYVYPLQFRDDGSIEHIVWNNTVSFAIQVA